MTAPFFSSETVLGVDFRRMVEEFSPQARALLDSFGRTPQKDSPASEGFRELLNGWSALSEKGQRSLIQVAQEILGGYEAAVDAAIEADRATATDFNLLRTLGLEGDELSHSRLLAWCLDRRATHSQGSLALKLLLQELRLPVEWAELRAYRVVTEVHGEESRIDIEVASPGRFLLHIENKIWSGEGERQLLRESADLRRRAEELKVSPECAVGFFLTLEGREGGGQGHGFRPLSWQAVARVIEEFARQARAESIRWFAAHYGEILRGLTAQALEKDEGP